ncbi:hypothetical protein MQX03_00995 [Chryseobacterium aahli]|uniref:hypothetical protein n=1 Tax=Chryseobacterium aahli TaxID=1278643 RepID=UPI001F61D876|nr:hypothetical protein [Chryseobacterium aahli]MCI3935757.1 hypothetical protein [Chryseobacterium aahli]
MGIFDFFKTKQQKENELNENEKLSSRSEKNNEDISNNKYYKPSNWTSNYIYGFINGNPMQKISNHDDLIEIIRNTVGNGKGYVAIDSIFHPYNLINHKGATAWDLAWFWLYAQNKGEIISEIAKNETATIVKSENLNLHENFRVWPNDNLNPHKNKQYDKFVPFILPYLTYSIDEKDEKYWMKMINAELQSQGHAHTYIENFNRILSNNTEGHIMTLGFGEFNRENLDELINKFTDFYEQNMSGK